MSGLEGTSLRAAVQFAITTEQIGTRAYRRLARNLEGDKEIAELFLALAEDEERHEAEFRALMETVPDRDAARAGARRSARSCSQAPKVALVP